MWNWADRFLFDLFQSRAFIKRCAFSLNGLFKHNSSGRFLRSISYLIGERCSVTDPPCFCCIRCICMAPDSRPGLVQITQKITNHSCLQCEKQFNVWRARKTRILFPSLNSYLKMSAAHGRCSSFYCAPVCSSLNPA